MSDREHELADAEQHPWQRSPAEVIGYALQLVQRKSDLSQRIAILLNDLAASAEPAFECTGRRGPAL